MTSWTPFLNELIELDSRNYSRLQMADHFYLTYPNFFPVPPTYDAIRKALARARSKARVLATSPKAVRTPYIDKYAAYLRGDSKVEKDSTLLENLLAKRFLKILVISDLHVPFMEEQKFQRAVDLNRNADMVVVAGDFLDCYNQSRWRKQKNIQHEVELDEGLRVLEYLSTTFRWVRIIRGNHDQRALKKVQDLLPPELLYLVDDEPLDLLTDPFPNVEYISDWWTQINDAIIGHQERSSTVDGKPAIYLMEYFFHKGWAKRLNLNPTPRLFVTGHTHQVSSMYREDIKMMETGCLCQVMEYTTDSSAVMRPPMNGCILITQEGGKTDFNTTREFVL